MFAQFQGDAGNLGDTSAAQNTFLEFLQRGKFAANMQKQPGPPHGPPHPMMENNNLQSEFQQQQQQQHQHQQPPQQQPVPSQMVHQAMMGSHGPLSVEELEARLRQAGPPASNSSNMPNDAMKSSQQDMIAFKKLVKFLVLF